MEQNKPRRNLLQIYGALSLFFILMITAIVIKFQVALETAEPIVDRDYYEVGRDVRAHSERIANSPDRILESNVMEQDRRWRSGEQNLEFSYFRTPDSNSANKSPIENAQIKVSFSRRATMQGRIEKTCETTAEGRCQINLTLPAAGFWEIRVYAEDTEGQYRYSADISII